MKLPEGEFDGEVYGYLAPFGRIWTGKVFTGNKVLNKIAGRLLFEGQVSSPSNYVFIYYPQFNITDVLLEDSFDDGSEWSGTMHYGRVKVDVSGWFVFGRELARFKLRRPNA
jgi:hypothetical protein